MITTFSFSPSNLQSCSTQFPPFRPGSAGTRAQCHCWWRRSDGRAGTGLQVLSRLVPGWPAAAPNHPRAGIGKRTLSSRHDHPLALPLLITTSSSTSTSPSFVIFFPVFHRLNPSTASSTCREILHRSPLAAATGLMLANPSSSGLTAKRPMNLCRSSPEPMLTPLKSTKPASATFARSFSPSWTVLRRKWIRLEAAIDDCKQSTLPRLTLSPYSSAT